VAGATIKLLRSAGVATLLGIGVGAVGAWAEGVSQRRWQPLGGIRLLVGSLTHLERDPLPRNPLFVSFGAAGSGRQSLRTNTTR
jgi:hypothetical protein